MRSVKNYVCLGYYASSHIAIRPPLEWPLVTRHLVACSSHLVACSSHLVACSHLVVSSHLVTWSSLVTWSLGRL